MGLWRVSQADTIRDDIKSCGKFAIFSYLKISSRTPSPSIFSCNFSVYAGQRQLAVYRSTPQAATIKSTVSHDFVMVKPTLPPGKKQTMTQKKNHNIILSKIKDFYYGPTINNVKRGFMTFNMENIMCAEKNPKLHDICKYCKIVMHAKISCFTEMCQKTCFFYS